MAQVTRFNRSFVNLSIARRICYITFPAICFHAIDVYVQYTDNTGKHELRTWKVIDSPAKKRKQYDTFRQAAQVDRPVSVAR